MANSAFSQVGFGAGAVAESNLAAGATLKQATVQASTSGTSIDFTGIPAGTRQITLMFSVVSTNGTSDILVQLGDSGGIETTGYNAGTNNYSGGVIYVGGAGFAIAIDQASAAVTVSGQIVLTLMDAATFLWAASSVAYVTVNNSVDIGAGTKALSAELDRVRVTTVNGTDTFDAGSINIAYK